MNEEKRGGKSEGNKKANGVWEQRVNQGNIRKDRIQCKKTESGEQEGRGCWWWRGEGSKENNFSARTREHFRHKGKD